MKGGSGKPKSGCIKISAWSQAERHWACKESSCGSGIFILIGQLGNS